MDVNEHKRLSNITLTYTQSQVKEQHFIAVLHVQKNEEFQLKILLSVQHTFHTCIIFIL